MLTELYRISLHFYVGPFPLCWTNLQVTTSCRSWQPRLLFS